MQNLRPLTPGGRAPVTSPAALSDTLLATEAAATAATDAWVLAATVGAAPPTPSPPVAEESAALLAGIPEPLQRVGRYLLLRPLGAGGMGVVYAAYDEELDRKVAIKVLRQAGHAHSERRTRILREAQAMARISHPNVVQVYEVGEVAASAGQVFIAMEFIEGTTLADWQRERGWEEVLPAYLAAGQGLLAAHESDLVHREPTWTIHPVGNVLFSRIWERAG